MWYKTLNGFEVTFPLKRLHWALAWKTKSTPKGFCFVVGLKLGNILARAKRMVQYLLS